MGMTKRPPQVATSRICSMTPLRCTDRTATSRIWVLGPASAMVPLALYVSRNLNVWAVAVHQRNVTRSLGDWEREYSRVGTWPEAVVSVTAA